MIHQNNISHGFAIAAAAGCSYNPSEDQVLSRVTSEGNLLGGVIFTSYTGASICMHTAGFAPNWISKDLLWICFDYPFVQLRCSKVLALIPSSNLKALDFNRRLGFTVETTIKEVYPDGDAIVISMDRSACRWLGLKPRRLSARSPVDGSV